MPETQPAVTLGTEKCHAFIIVFLLLKMLGAIHFNGKFDAWCTEIDDIVSNSVLSAEMHAIAAMRAQRR